MIVIMNKTPTSTQLKMNCFIRVIHHKLLALVAIDLVLFDLLVMHSLQGKKLTKDLEQVEVDDDDGGDVSDEDEALDIDPHDIEHAKERGEWCSTVGQQLSES